MPPFDPFDDTSEPAPTSELSTVASDHTDANVMRSLVARATGMHYTRQVLDKFGNVHELQEYLPPDVPAIRTYAAGRWGERWQGADDRRQVAVPVVNITLAVLPGQREAIEHEKAFFPAKSVP